mmetsp:Transcript_14478/g.29185  ORF Transcript_14478/g.29185 Transcript_14478/m.29185 type:complete len:255 (+) Transcript_14478:202-966(+)
MSIHVLLTFESFLAARMHTRHVLLFVVKYHVPFNVLSSFEFLVTNCASKFFLLRVRRHVYAEILVPFEFLSTLLTGKIPLVGMGYLMSTDVLASFEELGAHTAFESSIVNSSCINNLYVGVITSLIRIFCCIRVVNGLNFLTLCTLGDLVGVLPFSAFMIWHKLLNFHHSCFPRFFESTSSTINVARGIFQGALSTLPFLFLSLIVFIIFVVVVVFVVVTGILGFHWAARLRTGSWSCRAWYWSGLRFFWLWRN